MIVSVEIVDLDVPATGLDLAGLEWMNYHDLDVL